MQPGVSRSRPSGGPAHQHRPAAPAALLAAAAIVLLAGAAATPRAGEPEPVTHTIVMEGTSFAPPALTIRLGDAVQWVNRDFFPHTATAAGRFDSGIVAAGQTWRLVPDETGELKYVCTLHPTMTGVLTVE